MMWIIYQINILYIFEYILNEYIFSWDLLFIELSIIYYVNINNPNSHIYQIIKPISFYMSNLSIKMKTDEI